jgi:hypothetical protein
VIVTSSWVRQRIKAHPEKADGTFQAIGDTERIGVVSFDYFKPSSDDDNDENKGGKKVKEPIDLSKITLDDISHAAADQAWFPITKDDPWVRVTIT